MPVKTAETESKAHSHIRRTNLAMAVDEHGPLVVEPANDLFQRFVRSIISQQVSTASAAAVRERLFDTFEVTPPSLLAADQQQLRDVGLSRQKADYVQNVAEAFTENEYTHEYFDGMDDSAVTEELLSIKGVGKWTAKIMLMFGLGREDVFPVEDLGIRKGMNKLYGTDLTRSEMMEKSAVWEPHRTVASLYLWRISDD